MKVARGAALFVLLAAVMAAPSLPAQPDAERERLRRELKGEVDRVLLTAMRSLRQELHGLIDAKLGGPEPWPPAEALQGAETARPHEDPAVSGLAARLAALERRWGAEHPELRGLAAELEALRQGEARPPPRLDAGLEVVPASAEYRALHRLPEGVGLRIVTLPEGSSLAARGVAAGDVLAYTGQGPIRSLADLERSLQQAPPGGEVLIQLIGQRDGLRRVVAVARPEPAESARPPAPPEFPDPEATIDEMLRRAIRQVVPRSGELLLPDRPGSGGEKGEGPPRGGGGQGR